MALTLRNETIDEYLKSDVLDNGLPLDLRQQLMPILKEEESYQYFARPILSPSADLSEKQRVEQSYRALKVFLTELDRLPDASLVNATKAGLLAKCVFASLEEQKNEDESTTTTRAQINLYHVRKLLEALLNSYPSSVVSAACAGGMDGMDCHFGPLMQPSTSSQTIPTLTSLVIHGTTGRTGQTSAERTQNDVMKALQQQQVNNGRSSISLGHRRKFIHNLSEWGFMSRLIQCIQDDYVDSGEEVCEAILTIIECVGYPDELQQQKQATNNNKGTASSDPSAGEADLLAALGTMEIWEPLLAQLESPTTLDSTRVSAARVMMGIFALSTGSSSRVRKMNAPVMDATEIADEANNKSKNSSGVDGPLEHENKMLEWGLTAKIHDAVVGHLPRICHALLQRPHHESDTDATTYWDRGDDEKKNSAPAIAVSHPGRCKVVPFTSWRLQLCSLLAEILAYEPRVTTNDEEALMAVDGKMNCRRQAMDTIMELTLSPELQKKGSASSDSSGTAFNNPWPTLCEWVFAYPETTLYHVQFTRLFRSICLEHHEATLRLVLQKAKFVSRAIKTCQAGSSPLRGMLLLCLNTLRLRAKSLAPSAFLRQFLESHDAWKKFYSSLIEITNEQQLPFGGSLIAGREEMFVKNIGIGLGSSFASELGFAGVDEYKEGTITGNENSTPTNGEGATKKKKKKNNRKRKKKRNSSVPSEADEEGDSD